MAEWGYGVNCNARCIPWGNCNECAEGFLLERCLKHALQH